MAGIDLATATSLLAEYEAALFAVLKSQSYTILGRTLVRADIVEIEKGIDKWNREVCRLTNNNKLTICRVLPNIQ